MSLLSGITRCLSTFVVAASAVFAAANLTAADNDGWISLFDGKTLDGWHKNPQKIGHGTGGEWTVEDGAIVGQQDPPGSGNGGILLTDRKFKNFEVMIDLKPDWGICSGFFLRSNDQGKCLQMMVDYHDAGDVGHIYGEGTGGFNTRPFNLFGKYENEKLVSLTTKPVENAPKVDYTCMSEEWLKAWKVNDWNTARVRVVGSPAKMTTWINDVKIIEWDGTTYDDPKYDKQKVIDVLGDEGSIAVQVHGGKSWPVGAKCRWKNVKVKVLDKPSASKMTSRQDAKTQRVLLFFLFFASLRLGERFPVLSIGSATADEPREITNSLGMRFVRIPAGEFLMGSPVGDDQAEPDELPQHAVRIAAPFYLGACEVTQAEFELVTGENPSWFSSTGGGRDAVADRNTVRLPVEMVSWNDAVSFCRRLSELEAERTAKRIYRLPTEAEWEYAGRAGTTTRFAFGNAIGSSEANFADPGANPPLPQITRPVGSYLPNAWGLHDMHGNVWEWCNDWYAADAYVTAKTPIEGNGRVVRGGSYQFAASQARSANRDFTRPTRRDWGNGLRLVLE